MVSFSHDRTCGVRWCFSEQRGCWLLIRETQARKECGGVHVCVRKWLWQQWEWWNVTQPRGVTRGKNRVETKGWTDGWTCWSSVKDNSDKGKGWRQSYDGERRVGWALTKRICEKEERMSREWRRGEGREKLKWVEMKFQVLNPEYSVSSFFRKNFIFSSRVVILI